MKEYLFFIEGLNREVWFTEKTESLARAGVWNSLTNDEQDAVAQIDCLDEKEATANSVFFHNAEEQK